jgi:hypothetical protein
MLRILQDAFRGSSSNIFITSDLLAVNMQAAGSVSRVRLVAEIAGKGSAECEVVRHLAPLTTSILLKGLPVQDRVHRLEDKLIYIETGLVIGAEKSRTQFKRSDLAFMPSNGAICFIVKDCTTQAMSALGKIINNIEVIEGVQTGDVITVKRISPATT